MRHADPIAAAYAGWSRVDGGPWLVACTAATRGGCWDALLRVPKAGRSAERCVLEAGRSPGDGRRR